MVSLTCRNTGQDGLLSGTMEERSYQKTRSADLALILDEILMEGRSMALQGLWLTEG